MIRQVDFRQFVQPGILHDRATSAASPGASAARHLVRRSRKFIVDFPRLRLLDGPRFNAVVLSHEPVQRQFANLRLRPRRS